MDVEKRRMITGHSGKGVDETTYGSPAALYQEILKLPPYKFNSHGAEIKSKPTQALPEPKPAFA